MRITILPRLARRAGALGLSFLPTLACTLPDDGAAMTTGADTAAGTEDSGGTTGTSASTGDTTASTVADTSGGSTETSGGPPPTCEADCAQDELCFDGSCHPIGFSEAFGGGTSRQTFWDVAIDADQNLLVAGNFDDFIELGDLELDGAGEGLEAMVAKLDPTGAPIWAHAYVNEGFAHEVANGIAVDGEGNVLVVGELQETVDFGTGPLVSAGDTDVFVLKLDPAGETVWAHSFGDALGQHVVSAAAQPDGSVVFTGSFTGTLDLGGDTLVAEGDSTDLYVAAIGPDGEHRWSFDAGDGDYQYGNAIATDAAGNVVVCGEFSGQVDLGGGPIDATFLDLFVAKFDADGQHQWSIANHDGADDSCTSVAIDAAGRIAITGRYAEGLDFGGGAGLPDDTYRVLKYAAMFDGDGGYVWSRGFGTGTSAEMGGDTDEIALDSAGNVILTGTITASADFGGGPLPSEEAPSIFVAKLDPDGGHLWSSTWPSDNLRQAILGLAIDTADDVVLAGEFSGDLDLGFGPMSSPLSPDALVARFLP